jgi:hypothetical protein
MPIDTRYKNAYIFGAFCPKRDTAVGLILPTVNATMMQLHLDTISEQLPANTHAAMIIDGAGWHLSKDLSIPHNISLIKIPPRSPELNPAEKPWQYLKNNFLSNLVLNSYEDILEACQFAWNSMANEVGRIKSLTNFPYFECNVI